MPGYPLARSPKVIYPLLRLGCQIRDDRLAFSNSVKRVTKSLAVSEKRLTPNLDWRSRRQGYGEASGLSQPLFSPGLHNNTAELFPYSDSVLISQRGPTSCS